MSGAVITLARYGTDLSSRATGVAVRDAMVFALTQGAECASMDCTGIRTLNDSCADEVRGIPVAEHGKPRFEQHIAVTGLTESTRAAILRAKAERLYIDPAA